jgi:hypothetical protein
MAATRNDRFILVSCSYFLLQYMKSISVPCRVVPFAAAMPNVRTAAVKPEAWALAAESERGGPG